MNKTFPDGHFYSPVPSVVEVIKNKEKIWAPKKSTVGIDYNDPSHVNILKNIYPNYLEKYDYKDEGINDEELTYFYNKNSQFSWLDSRTLFVFFNI